jgi:hypothetical protein
MHWRLMCQSHCGVMAQALLVCIGVVLSACYHPCLHELTMLQRCLGMWPSLCLPIDLGLNVATVLCAMLLLQEFDHRVL